MQLKSLGSVTYIDSCCWFSLLDDNFSKKKFPMEVLGMCLPYVQRYFQEHQLSVFFCMAQTNHFLLFSGIPV